LLYRILVVCLFFLVSGNADTLTSISNYPIKVSVDIDTISSSIPINLKLEKTEDKNDRTFFSEYLTPFLPTIIILASMFFSYLQTKSQINATFITAQNQLDSSLKISKQQIHAQVISTNRQVWINSLRDAVAELLSELAILTNQTKRNDFSNEEFYKEPITGYVKNIVLLRTKIELLNNPNEEKSQILDSAINNYVNICVDPDQKDASISSKARDKVIDTTKEILKAEWERVKNIE